MGLSLWATLRASGGLCRWASSLAVGSKEGLNESRDWNQMGLSQKLCSTTWTDVTSLSQCCSSYTCLYVHCAQTSVVGSGIQLWTQHCSSPDRVHSQIRKADVYRVCYNPPCQLSQYLLDRPDAAWGGGDSTEEFTGTEKHYRKKSIAEAVSWEKMACSGDANSSLWLGYELGVEDKGQEMNTVMYTRARSQRLSKAVKQKFLQNLPAWLSTVSR